MLSEDAQDSEALNELERLATLRKAFAELADLFETRLSSAHDPEVQRGFALKLAALYEEKLKSEDKAIAHYRRVRELPGDEMVALAALDRLLSKSSATSELSEILEREAEVAPEALAQAEFLFRLGELRSNVLYDLDGALAAFKRAIERNAQHHGARDALERLIASPAHARRLGDLGAAGRARARLQQALELLEVRVSSTSGKGERASLLERMAQIAEKELGDPSRAFDALGAPSSRCPRICAWPMRWSAWRAPAVATAMPPASWKRS